MQQVFAAMLSLADGVSLVTETVYESRFRYTTELAKMGAKIYVENRAAKITGVARLSGASVSCTDLRGGAALLVAGMAADGRTDIDKPAPFRPRVRGHRAEPARTWRANHAGKPQGECALFSFVPELGVDLGTANILVYVRGKGIVLREPSVVAIAAHSKKVLAVGEEARLMLGRTPGNIVAIRPMSDGVIADYTTTQKMLEYIFAKVVGRKRLFKPRVLVCVPSQVTSVEKRAVRHAALEAGASEAHTIEEPMAAAIGAGLPISMPGGNMVVDIGGGTTDIAVISLEGIVTSESLRVAGNRMDEVIIRHVKSMYSLMIGDRTAEEIKVKVGSAYSLEQELSLEVRGRDLVAGLPKTVSVTSVEVREALAEPVMAIVEKVKRVLEQTPPELAADIIERGIVLTGGGALLRGFDRLLSAATNIPVYVAEDPLSCVAIGTGRALEEYPAIRASERYSSER